MRLLILLLSLLSLVEGTSSSRRRSHAVRSIDANNTAYFAFRISDTKISERVRLLDEAALNVSLDFAPFLVDPNKLIQPLLAIHLEDDEVSRAADIYDQQLQRSVCFYLPRRLPYTEFKVVKGAMLAMSQTDMWISIVKDTILKSLNRHGFISLSDLDTNMVLITNPRGTKLTVDEIDIRQLKLTASAYIDRFYICRGSPPTPDFAEPCDVAVEFPVIKCPHNALLNASLEDFLRQLTVS